MNNVLNAFIETDATGCIRYWGREAEEALGWTAGEVSGCNFFSFIDSPPSTLPELSELRSSTIILAGRHQDERTIDLEASFISESLLNNDRSGFLIFLRDIGAERKQAQWLRQNEERNRQIFENALDAVVVANTQGIVLTWNRHAQTTFG